jgi:transcriptional regulator with XRE-family HTH domain
MQNFPIGYPVIMKIEEVIGSNIKKARESVKKTQKSLAESVRVTKHHIEDIEAGRRKPSVDLLVRIASALGVESGSLLDQGEIIEPRPLPFKTVLGMYSNIPEKYVKALSGYREGDDIWGMIEEAIEAREGMSDKDAENRQKG